MAKSGNGNGNTYGVEQGMDHRRETQPEQGEKMKSKAKQKAGGMLLRYVWLVCKEERKQKRIWGRRTERWREAEW